jgi:hypothetical protein
MPPELSYAIPWAIVVVVALLLFRQPLSRLVDRLTSLKVKIAEGRAIEISARDAASIVQELLEEADRLIAGVGPWEQQLLARIHSAPQMMTVEQLIPGFRPESDEHQRLRKMREMQLIRPAGSSQWRPEKYVEVKPFGRILLRIRPEKLLGTSKPDD